MYEDVIEIRGKKSGPISMVIGGVHGNEKCGIEALDNLLPTLKIDAGTVLFAYGNPRAIEENVRYTEANLNRMFKADNELSEEEKRSYEYQRAQFLKPYLNRAEALLDVHASTVPESRVFAICEEIDHDVVQYLPTPLLVSGFDEVEPGGTDMYMHTLGKIGICLECGYFGDPKSTSVAEEGILSFLAARGHTTGTLYKAREQTRLRMYLLYLTKTDSFRLARDFEDFETIEKDELIGTDGTQEIRAPKKSSILFAHNRDKIRDEVFLLGEKLP